MNDLKGQYFNIECSLNKDLEHTYKWRDRKGLLFYPSDMETKHLFFTLRMIWNYTCPEHMKLEPYKVYIRFPDFYNKKYFIRSIKEMVKEITKRKDLDSYFLDQIGKMMYYMQDLRHFRVRRV